MNEHDPATKKSKSSFYPRLPMEINVNQTLPIVEECRKASSCECYSDLPQFPHKENIVRVPLHKSYMHRSSQFYVNLTDDDLNASQLQQTVSAERSVKMALPLSLELIGGKGDKLTNSTTLSSGNLKSRAPLPSQSLATSASILKSYFMPSFGVEKSKSDSKGDEGILTDSELPLKTKVLGLWNNVKYGWTVNLKTNFSKDAPVYLLGKVYHKSFGEEGAEDETSKYGIDGFKRDFQTLVWCTYRRQFPPLGDSNITSDCGWGCMLRSGQMMLALALMRQFLPADWKYSRSGSESDPLEIEIHHNVIRWFGDSTSEACPLSLHNLVHFGQNIGKKAGDWYGPASVAYIFREAVLKGSKYIADLQKVCVYVAQDYAVYIQDVLDLSTSPSCLCNLGIVTELSNVNRVRIESLMMQNSIKSSNSLRSRSIIGDEVLDDGIATMCAAGGHHDLTAADRLQSNSYPSLSLTTPSLMSWYQPSQSLLSSQQAGDCFKDCPGCDNWRSVLILVPVRLGSESLNPIYHSCIYGLLTHDLCIGIIGGRPKHSLYFVGFQDDSLIHLDPHLCQDAVGVTQAEFPLSSYHCSSPRKMTLSRMDPSATLGFHCRTRQDFYRLMQEIPDVVTPRQSGYDYPIFEFVNGRCQDTDAYSRQLSNERMLAASLPGDTPLLPQDSEEFVFL